MTASMGRPETNLNAEPVGPSDVELITAARAGDGNAFATLYTRHAEAARRLARALSRRRADVDDLIAEAYTRVFVALQRGGGPDLAFRPYLYTTLRRIAIDRGIKDGREVATEHDELDRDLDSTEPFVDPALDELERSMAVQAYRQLPERWQAVLWYTEVEDMAPNEVGELLGLSANAAAALAYRAREGLRQSYLQVHLTTEPLRTCEPTIERLGAYVRGGVSERERVKVEEHLDECERCRALYLELADVNHGMRVFVAPMFLGVGAGGLALKGGVVAWFGRVLRPRTPAQAAAVGVSAAATVAAAVAVAVAFGGSSSRVAETSTTSTPPAGSSTQSPTSSIGVPTSATNSTTGGGSTTTVTATTSLAGIVPTTSPIVETTDPPVTNATTSVPPTTAVPAPADLSVSMSDVGALVAGRTGIVSVTVVNRGAGPARAVTIEVGVPDGVEVSLAAGRTPTGSSPSRRADTCRSGAVIECDLGDVEPGSDAAQFLRVSPTMAGELSFSLRVRSASLDANPGDDSRTFATRVHDSGLSARWAGTGHLDVVTTGNSNLSCPITDPDCANARRRVGGSLRNNQFEMTYVDVDSDETTYNSSSADLTLSGEVAFAALYWGADRADGIGLGAAAIEAAGTSHHVTAERVDAVGTRFQSFADVTAIVRAAGSGRYTVANIAADVGTDRYAGWSLVVVIRADVFPDRSVAIFDGLLGVETGIDAHATIGGFRARSGGEVRVGLVAYEGDAGTGGDAVRVDGLSVADAANPSDDVMNSTISTDGRITAGRSPNDANTFGVDVDVIDASGVIRDGATSASLDFTTDGDVYLVGAAVAVVDR
jgi:RNA polymerase sigma factor (sigma-70 family)